MSESSTTLSLTSSLATPIMTTMATPNMTNMAKPIMITRATPNMTNMAKPIMITRAKPIMTTMAKPIMITRAKPIMTTMAKPIMTTMATPIPTQTLQPTDASVIPIYVLSAVAMLYGLIMIIVLVCLCGHQLRHRRRMSTMQAVRVDELAPLLGDDKRIPVTPENAGDDQPEPEPPPQAVQPPPQAQVVKTDLGSSVAGHTDHLMLFRIHVSRKAARKATAVLEGLGLDQNTIDACISAHPLNDEEIVQDGLTRWCGGKGTQPPTWNVLINAMHYAGIAQQDIGKLKQKLGH